MIKARPNSSLTFRPIIAQDFLESCTWEVDSNFNVFEDFDAFAFVSAATSSNDPGFTFVSPFQPGFLGSVEIVPIKKMQT